MNPPTKNHCLLPRLLRQSLFSVCLIGVNFIDTRPVAAAELSCDNEYRVSTTFENGAGWDMCWTSTRRENIVLSEIHYRPADQAPYKVISSIRLAQLHVTYDDSNVTYNDVTQFGLGGGYVSTLQETDCPEGELLLIQDRPGLCKQIGTNDLAFHSDNESALKETLSLFSISQVGSYAYLVTWKFHDDGSIEPSIGAAGALQRSADHEHAEFGRELEGTPGKVWLSHTHNYYWRIDFDLGENAQDDVVTEVSYPIETSGKRSKQELRLSKEVARKINPEHLTAWYITDGEQSIAHAPGYLIEPINYGHKLVRTAQEPFTDFDFFVTRQNDCERFINENTKFNPDCGDDILQFTDNESLINEDLVVWHRISFHHVPRNEDREHMHSHWDGFLIQARNLSSKTPGHSGVNQNSAPVVQHISDQRHRVGENIALQVASSDVDGDILSYQVSGLPEGLTLSKHGLIEGTATHAGHFHVAVHTADGIHTTSSHFNWAIENTKNSGSIGRASPLVLLLLLALRRQTKARIDAA